MEMHDRQEYDSAIAAYLTIPASDTNYVWMLSELMFSYLSSGQNEKAIATAREALQFQSQYKEHIMIGLGNAYDNIGETDKAIEIYKQALLEFPFDYLLHFNLGISYFKKGMTAEAIQCLQHALKINPFHAGSHEALGKIMILQGMKTKALLSLETYLTLAPSNNTILVLLENMLDGAVTDEGSLVPTESNAAFHELDQIIRSKAALDHRFKPNVEFNASIVRQTELILEELKFNPRDSDFWMQYYVPFYKDIYREGLLEPFTYYLLTSVNNDKINNWLEDHQKELQKMYALANQDLKKARALRTVKTSNGNVETYTCWYFDSNRFNALGNKDSKGNPVGEWQYFYENGQLQAKGIYSAKSEKNGLWVYFYNSGQVKKEENYDENGNLSGETINYAEDGARTNVIPFQDDKINGTVKLYYACGAIKEEIPFNNDLREGDGKACYADGQIKVNYRLTNDHFDGPYKIYFPDGSIKEEDVYKQGQLEGPFVSYFMNGQIEQQGTYVNGSAEGEWVSYFESGHKDFYGNFKNNHKIGVWTTYHENGMIREIQHLDDNGKNIGTTEYYDDDGILYFTNTYQNDTLTGYQYFDKQGQILSEAQDEHGNFKVSAYFPNGSLNYEGVYKNGVESGDFTFYHLNGNKKYTIHIEHGKWQGPYLEYYETGEISLTANYTDNDLDGYYREFFKNGKVKEEGWYAEGQRQQTWNSYNAIGIRTNRIIISTTSWTVW